MEKKKLYVKNEKGRYEEYREPVQEWDNKLYRKVGKKYEPCSMLITQDLNEGVWVITKHQHGKSFANGKYLYENFMCMKAGDIQEVSLAKLGGMDKLADYLCDNWDKLPKEVSRYDICRAIVGILFNYDKENEERE